MAKNDYYVIVYKILSYLYECLKRGIKPDIEEISADSSGININDEYWRYIMVHMLDSGLIEGAYKIETHEHTGIKFANNFNITPDGITYLQENSAIQNAARMLDNPIVKLASGLIGIK